MFALLMRIASSTVITLIMRNQKKFTLVLVMAAMALLNM